MWAGKNGGGARLDKLLKSAKLSSAQLARELKRDPSTISKYRDGSRVPDAETLAYLIKRAGGSADEVLGLRPMGSIASRAGFLRYLDAISERAAAARKEIVAASKEEP